MGGDSTGQVQPGVGSVKVRSFKENRTETRGVCETSRVPILSGPFY